METGKGGVQSISLIRRLPGLAVLDYLVSFTRVPLDELCSFLDAPGERRSLCDGRSTDPGGQQVLDARLGVPLVGEDDDRMIVHVSNGSPD